MWHYLRRSSRFSKLVRAGTPASEDAQVRSHLCLVVNLVFDDAEKHNADGSASAELSVLADFLPATERESFSCNQGLLMNAPDLLQLLIPRFYLAQNGKQAQGNASLVVTPVTVEGHTASSFFRPPHM